MWAIREGRDCAAAVDHYLEKKDGVKLSASLQVDGGIWSIEEFVKGAGKGGKGGSRTQSPGRGMAAV